MRIFKPGDFYHFTTTVLSKQTDICFEGKKIFALFIRNNETYFTPPDIIRYVDILEDAKQEGIIDGYSVLGAKFNKGLLPVTKFIPIIYTWSNTLSAIQLESILINKIQLDLIYTTRLLRIKQIAEKYFPNAKLLDFGLRRAPSIEAANRFSEIAISLGYLTSNTNMPLGFVRGTIPHAFIQSNADDVKSEIKFWKYMMLVKKVNLILPDTYDYSYLLKQLFSDENVRTFIKKYGLVIRVDTTNHLSTLQEIDNISTIYGISHKISYIVSGDLQEDSIKTLAKKYENREKIIGLAIGTQVVNNIKPLSIVYKLVQIGLREVSKNSPGKGQLEGYHIVEYDETYKPELFVTSTIYEYDHGIYPIF